MVTLQSFRATSECSWRPWHAKNIPFKLIQCRNNLTGALFSLRLFVWWLKHKECETSKEEQTIVIVAFTIKHSRCQSWETVSSRAGREEANRCRSADAAIPRVAYTFGEFLLFVVKKMRVCGAVMECFQKALCDSPIRYSAIFATLILEYLMALFVSI